MTLEDITGAFVADEIVVDIAAAAATGFTAAVAAAEAVAADSSGWVDGSDVGSGGCLSGVLNILRFTEFVDFYSAVVESSQKAFEEDCIMDMLIDLNVSWS